MPRRRTTDQAGLSLIEVLAALLIASTAVVAFLAGTAGLARFSATDRSTTDADATLRAAAEAVAEAPYAPCADAQVAYAVAVAATEPERWSVQVASVRDWDGSIDPVGFEAGCTDGPDPGLQEIVLRAIEPDGSVAGELSTYKRST